MFKFIQHLTKDTGHMPIRQFVTIMALRSIFPSIFSEPVMERNDDDEMFFAADGSPIPPQRVYPSEVTFFKMHNDDFAKELATSVNGYYGQPTLSVHRSTISR